MKLCGIDEAGRGPIAGPLVMAGAVLRRPVEGLADSKALSEKRREALYTRIAEAADFHIVRFDARTIDDKGISACLAAGLCEILEAIDADDYLFDGNSTFGVAGLRTQVKADASVPEVSAASILAKVTRDREMNELARRWPHYGFDTHKGYGTKAHIEAIRRYGYCDVHRRTFRVKALQPALF